MENIELHDLDEQVRIRHEKLRELQAQGNDPFEVTTFPKTHNSGEILANYEKFDNKSCDVAVAGRIVLKRVMGKASFAHILDEQGRIQLYIAVNDLGDAAYEAFKKWDLGDIVGAKGFVFKTKTGEISVHVKELVLLAKALIPLPDKHHGLKDADLRFRERYVDLIVNPEVKQIFTTRSKIISAIREFLDGEGFLEVETPILQTIAGGAEARPFITHHNTYNMPMYLRIAPELYLKRLIVGGYEKVYELARNFRNEGVSYKHNPEFTMLELYQAYTDYNGMADLIERLFRYVLQKVIGTTKITYEGHQLDFGKPWRRVKMFDIAKSVKDFEDNIEPTLIQPTIVLDYPIEISPLAKKKKGSPQFTERFEYFICGREFGNAYSELNDPIDQRERFVQQMKEREKGNDEAHMLDEDFVNALSYGMPPTGGLGLGIDRLIMLITGVHSIRECLLFPTMKPKSSKENKSFKLAINKDMAKFGQVTIGVLEAEITPKADMAAVKNYTRQIIASEVKRLQQNAPDTLPQIKKWKKIFSDMKADTNKTSSVVFLTNWLCEKGKLFNIHPIVDLYNAISVKYGLPMGAYDVEKVKGTLELRLAKQGENFIGINGKDTEQTNAGEVVYADEQGITCRLWNFKDSDRTKITKATTKFAVFFDGIGDAELIQKAQADMEAALKGFTCKSYIVTL